MAEPPIGGLLSERMASVHCCSRIIPCTTKSTALSTTPAASPPRTTRTRLIEPMSPPVSMRPTSLVISQTLLFRLFGGPSSEQPAHEHELAEVISVVIGHQERLAQDRLPLAVRDARKEVRRRVLNQARHRVQVSPERRDAPVPGAVVRRRGGRGPV